MSNKPKSLDCDLRFRTSPNISFTIKSTSDSVQISAELILAGELPGITTSTYSYLGHIKHDPQANWTANIPDDARSWELAQRESKLWETVLEDGTYSHEPWNNRPAFIEVAEKIEDEGHSEVARTIREAFAKVS